MSAILFGIFTILLILVSGYLVLIILMQRASSNSGLGASLGGGAAESALGAGAGNVLTKGTIWGSAAFFILSFGLYLGFLAQAEDTTPTNILPTEIATPQEDVPAAATPQKPLVKLPEGMEFSATANLGGESSSTVAGGDGTMTVTVPSEATEPAESITDQAADAPVKVTDEATNTEATTEPKAE